MGETSRNGNRKTNYLISEWKNKCERLRLNRVIFVILFCAFSLHRNFSQDETKLLADSVCQNNTTSGGVCVFQVCARVECGRDLCFAYVYSNYYYIATAIHHTCYQYQHYQTRKRKGIEIDWIETHLGSKILTLADFRKTLFR